MRTDPFRVFESEDDHLLWDKYVEQIEFIELTGDERRRVVESIIYLRHIFGENFLRRASRKHHAAFDWFFTNAAPCARLSLIRFADQLQELQDAADFAGLVRRLRDPEKFEEGLSVLETAHKFLTAGFAVGFDPSMSLASYPGRAAAKEPDLRLIDQNTGEELFVEVSRLRASDIERQASRTNSVFFNLLHNALDLHRVWSFCRFSRPLNEAELLATYNRIKALIEEVRRDGEFRQVIDDTIEIGIAPEEKEPLVREWAEARGIENIMDGVPIPVDEVPRLTSRIKKESRQLPHDKPGILVISTTENPLFFSYDIRYIAAVLEAEARKYPKLLCIVVTHNFDGGDEEAQTVMIGRHTLVRRVRNDKAIEQCAIVLNENCDKPVSTTTLERVQRAFTNP